MAYINNIRVDYEKGEIVINNKKIVAPVKVVIKQDDGFDAIKLFNNETYKQGMLYPEIVIDTRNFFCDLQKQELKNLIRDVLREEKISQKDN